MNKKERAMLQVSEEYNNKVIKAMNKQAWVKAGTAVNAGSASEAARQAGLDWTVELSDMFVERKTIVSPFESITDRLDVPKRQAVIKRTEDNESVIGVVGDKYKIVQNMEVFSALDSLVDSGDARYTAAGEYNNGANIWMVMELPTGVQVANDPHAAYLLVQSSHDGSCAVRIRPIIERLYCANQINRIIKGKHKNAYTYVMKHTTNSELSVSDIRNITQLTYDSIQEYETVASTLLERKVDERQVQSIFKRVWALPSEIEEAPDHLLSQGQRRQRTIALNGRDSAWNIYSQSPTQENIRGTAFGVWQAVIEHADHYGAGGADRRAVATISGRSDRIKDKALDLVLA
jgi:phage/plasmid-like protein (TIGR03299 family)